MQKQNNSFQKISVECEYCSNLTSNHQIINFNAEMYKKYSSSQDYYYTKQLNQIIEESSTPANIIYEDNEFYDQQEEYLRRIYKKHQYNGKMISINEYYFYHEDKPRLFNKDIVLTYMRWQQKRKKLLYKKLKKMLNESHESQKSSANQSQNQAQNIKNNSHILNDLSQYNPKSNRYYLKEVVQTKKISMPIKKQTQNMNQNSINQNSVTLAVIQKDLKSVLMKYSFVEDLSNIFQKKQIQQFKQPQKFIQSPTTLTITTGTTSAQKVLINKMVQSNFKKKQGRIQQLQKYKPLRLNLNAKQLQQKFKKQLAPLNTLTINNPFKKKDSIDIKGTKYGTFMNEKLKIQNFPQDIFKITQKPSNEELKQSSSSNTVRIKIKRKSDYVKSTQKLQKPSTLQYTAQKKTPSLDFKSKRIDQFSDKKIVNQIQQIRTHRSENIEIKTKTTRTNFHKISPTFHRIQNINLLTLTKQPFEKNLKKIQDQKIKQILGLRLQGK